VEYLELPQEPSLLIESHRPPAYWPSNTDNESLVVVNDLVVVSDLFVRRIDRCVYLHAAIRSRSSPRNSWDFILSQGS
jgi:hypothetical protein